MTRDEGIRRCRLGDLRKLFRHRYGMTMPDDDAGREDLRELLLVASMAFNAERMMLGIIAQWAPWMNKAEAAEVMDDVNTTPIYLRKPNGRILGDRLRLTDQERTTLGIRTIRPFDLTEEEFLERRKGRKQYLKWLRQRRAGKPTRAEWLATHSLSRDQPWKAEGVCKATWYRRQKRQRETGSSGETGAGSIKLLSVSSLPVARSEFRGESGTGAVAREQKREKKGRVA